MTIRCSGYQIMKKIKAILFSCCALIYLSLENYIASVVVLWRQAYFQGAAQQRWSPWNHSCCHGIGATAVLKQCTVQWCCQRIGATTVHTGHTLHSVAHTVLLSQNCATTGQRVQSAVHTVLLPRIWCLSILSIGAQQMQGWMPGVRISLCFDTHFSSHGQQDKAWLMSHINFMLKIIFYVIFTKSSEEW